MYAGVVTLKTIAVDFKNIVVRLYSVEIERVAFAHLLLLIGQFSYTQNFVLVNVAIRSL